MSISPKQIKETFYNTYEAGKLLGLTSDTVKRYCNADPPRIVGHKLFGEEGQWFIPQSSIDKYLTQESRLGRKKTCQQNGHRKK